jgi:hypothetical protein
MFVRVQALRLHDVQQRCWTSHVASSLIGVTCRSSRGMRMCDEGFLQVPHSLWMASGAATMLRNKILSCCTPRASSTCRDSGGVLQRC